jgi:hypothetical protein
MTQLFVKRIGCARIIIPALLVLIIAEVLFTAVLMPGFAEATGGLSALDMQVGFSAGEAYRQIGAYGSEGRRWYNWFQITDLFFPIAYGLFLSGCIAALVRRLPGGDKAAAGASPRGWAPALRWLPLLPLAAALCDLIENAGIFTMIRLYPDGIGVPAAVAMTAGLLKFAFIGLSVLAAVLLLLRFALRRRGRH